MKLFQVMAGARYGGAEEFFVRLALAFEKTNVDQRVAIRGHPLRRKQLGRGGVRMDTFSFGRWLAVRTKFGLGNITQLSLVSCSFMPSTLIEQETGLETMP